MEQKTETPLQNISFSRFSVKIIICLKNNFAITVNLLKYNKTVLCFQQDLHYLNSTISCLSDR